jgi:hypothetical protein
VEKCYRYGKLQLIEKISGISGLTNTRRGYMIKNTPVGYFVLPCIRKKLPVAGSGDEKPEKIRTRVTGAGRIKLNRKESEPWKKIDVVAAVTRRRCVPRRNAGN